MLQDGYNEVPAGKIAAVVTSLQMLARPVPCPEPSVVTWTLSHRVAPDAHWYRELFRRVGAEWLWFSRLRMPVEELVAVIHDPDVAVYAVSIDGRDEGCNDGSMLGWPEGCIDGRDLGCLLGCIEG